ncbi:hypothetical protein BSKO_01662 [Bryopsis sp. KO-2023]|nr:hypothetical protein BSKO_01662 [Bryopsis sp. KO-2023]
MAPSTVSLALPGSVIDNTQSWEQATLVAGQIARALAVFNVNEVVVFDDSGNYEEGRVGHGAAFLARVLQYLETPQYLRKKLIPVHKDLRLAGTLPPLDAPHHMRATEWKRYREGVIVEHKSGGSVVDVGVDKPAFVSDTIPVNTRVTVCVGKRPNHVEVEGENILKGKIVGPDTPLLHHAMYWGYTVRLAAGINHLFSECPFPDGYDLVIGTSEHGTEVCQSSFQLPNFQHALIVFGGPKGLEECCSVDPTLNGKCPADLFKMYLNTCPHQGSRTIRTEEAIWISLAVLRGPLQQNSRTNKEG